MGDDAHRQRIAAGPKDSSNAFHARDGVLARVLRHLSRIPSIGEGTSSLKRGAKMASSLGVLFRGPPLRQSDWQTLHHLLADSPHQDVPDSKRLARLARHGEVAALAWELVPALRAELEEAALKQRRVDALLELGLMRLARALGDRAPDLPVALLKGTAAASWGYRSTHLRFRRDLDLLVGDRIFLAREILLADGFTDDPGPKRSLAELADPTAPLRAWPMTLNLGGVTVSVDLHRRLVDRPWCALDPAALLAHRVPGRAPLPITDVTDTYLHTVAHLVQGGFHEPLKSWLDLLFLLPLVSPPSLASRAQTYGLTTAVWLTLDILERWFGRDTAPWRHPLEPPAWRRRLLTFLASGQHETPERQPLPRATSRRLWPLVLSDRPLFA